MACMECCHHNMRVICHCTATAVEFTCHVSLHNSSTGALALHTSAAGISVHRTLCTHKGCQQS